MFNKKSWKNRSTEYPNRRLIRNEDNGTSFTATVSRNEGVILEVGDAFSADNMNDLENRIGEETTYLEEDIAPVVNGVNATYNIGSGDYFIFNGQLMVATTAINKGVRVEQGANCNPTNIRSIIQAVNSKISSVNTSLSSSINSLSNSATVKHNALDKKDAELQASINSVNSSLTSRINSVDTKYRTTPVFYQYDERISFSNGRATWTKDVRNIGFNANNYIGVSLMPVEAEDVCLPTLTDGTKSRYTVLIKNLSNPNFSGTLHIIFTLVGYR